jgi:hypothetical protein
MAEATALPPVVNKETCNGGDQQPGTYGDPQAQASRRHPDFLSPGDG